MVTLTCLESLEGHQTPTPGEPVMKIPWKRKPSGHQKEFPSHHRPVWLLIFTAGCALNNQMVCSMLLPLLHDLRLVTGYL